MSPEAGDLPFGLGFVGGAVAKSLEGPAGRVTGASRSVRGRNGSLGGIRGSVYAEPGKRRCISTRKRKNEFEGLWYRNICYVTFGW